VKPSFSGVNIFVELVSPKGWSMSCVSSILPQRRRSGACISPGFLISKARQNMTFARISPDLRTSGSHLTVSVDDIFDEFRGGIQVQTASAIFGRPFVAAWVSFSS
jgi:hypothetical protein